MARLSIPLAVIHCALLACPLSAAPQLASAPPVSTSGKTPTPAAAEFLIGPEDVIGILFWREKEMTGDVTVRPDGVITLPLIGEIRAAGLSQTALAAEIQSKASRYLTDPNVTVMTRQINSRRVYITGEVNAPGAYPLTGTRTVMQAIALAGGVREFARKDEITVLRANGNQPRALRFNYDEVARGRRLEQNVELQPGDTIVVP
jgi:polysaccharide export outer membrane protein